MRDARRQQRFYTDVLDFAAVVEDPNGAFVFLRAPGSPNHHDLACFSIGERAGPSTAGRGQVGLYHLAWEVPTLDDLDDHRRRLDAAGALKGMSDHGVNKSLYAHDPDGIEFEVMWLTPPDSGATTSTKRSSVPSTSPPTSPASEGIGHRRRTSHRRPSQPAGAIIAPRAAPVPQHRRTMRSAVRPVGRCGRHEHRATVE